MIVVRGHPCGDAHGTGSHLGQGESSMRTYFPKLEVGILLLMANDAVSRGQICICG